MEVVAVVLMLAVVFAVVNWLRLRKTVERRKLVSTPKFLKSNRFILVVGGLVMPVTSVRMSCGTVIITRPVRDVAHAAWLSETLELEAGYAKERNAERKDPYELAIYVRGENEEVLQIRAESMTWEFGELSAEACVPWTETVYLHECSMKREN